MRARTPSAPGLESTAVAGARPVDPGACIETDVLAAMVDGRLPRDRVDAVLVHVDGCETCAEVMANVASIGGDRRTIGRYELRGELGSGAMGVVHDAWDPRLRRRVAIKLVRPDRADAAAHDRMLREAQALAQVSHPNVVAVHDAGEHDGEIYVATELIDGETIATWQRGQPARAIVEAWLQVARGLAAAHAEGIVHRDVKPANVLVGRDGRVRIGDFGLARLAGGELLDPHDAGSPPPSDASAIAGTPAYMAPEQLAGQFDARSDQFAFCVALAEALAHQRPSAGERPAVEPPRLADAIARGLAPRPADRFPGMDALADELAAAIAPPRRPPWRAIAIAAVAALGAGAVAVWAARGAPEVAACEVAQVPADLWSPERKALLATRFAPNVAERVERWLASWTAASADLCATGELPAVQDARLRCLAGALVDLRDRLATWDAHHAAAFARPRVALQDLPRLSRCSHAATAVGPNPAPAIAGLIAALRPAVHAARWRPDQLAAIRDLRVQLAAARAIGHEPFTVEVMVELAYVLQDNAHPGDAAATLREAIGLAEAAHDELSRATAIAHLLQKIPPKLDEAIRLDESARVALVALGGDLELEHRLDAGLGTAYRERDRLEDAIAAYDRAVRGLRAAHEPDSWDEANALLGLGGARTAKDPYSAAGKQELSDGMAMLVRLGLPLGGAVNPTDPDAVIELTKRLLALTRQFGGDPSAEFNAEKTIGTAWQLKNEPQAALDHYQRAIAIAPTVKKPDLSDLSDVYDRTARMLMLLGRPAEALEPSQRAYAIATEINVPRTIADALTTLGTVQTELGDPRGADPLERSLRMREQLKEAGAPLGRTRFQLARAVVGRDRRRALGLAAAARIDYESELRQLPDGDPLTPYQRTTYQRRIADIDRWLDALVR